MNKRSLLHLLLALFASLALVLAGCDDGDDGDPGPQGPQGPPGPPGEPGTGGGVTTLEGEPDIIVIPAEITDVTIPDNGQPVVTFTVSDADDQPIDDLSADNLSSGELRFIIAKLLPATASEPPNWQSYTNRTQTAAAGIGPDGAPVLESAVQATTENSGTLVNNGGGSYTYTFATDLRNVTTPFAVAYQPELTHRVAIQIEFEEEGEPLLVANPTFDFVPAGGAPADPQVALTSQCNECHDLLVVHGARIEIEYCVTCHNAGSAADIGANPATANYNRDPQSGNSIDLPVMVHKIHMGRELPSVADGELEYAIWGFRDTKHDYSEVGYPQDIRHCTKCHEGADTADEGEETAPEGDNWKQWPTIVNCTSCHDNIIINAELQGIATPAPEWMVEHSGGTGLTDESCSGCHPPESGIAPVTDSHTIPAQAASANFQYNLIGTSFDAATRTLSINFSVTNPNTGANYDIFQNLAFTQLGPGAPSRLFIDVGWPPSEFDNTGSGANPAQPITVDLLNQANVTANADGTYTTTAVIPAGVNAVGVALEGHPATANPDADEEGAAAFLRVPVTNAFTTVALAGGSAPERRQVVSIEKCNACHNTLSLHGNNRTDRIEVCVICHNPNATDVAVRPADMPEEAIDFKTMIHGLHANEVREDGTGLVVYGFGGTRHEFGLDSTTDEAVLFPGHLENCLNCHVEEAYQLPLDDNVLATTIDTGNDLTTPLDDVNISPATAFCYYCHNSERARAHMESVGTAQFNWTGNTFDPISGRSTESCTFCHGPRGTAPIDGLHAIEEQPVPPKEPVLGPVPEPPGTPANQPPTVNAGDDQTDVALNSPVQLNATASDPEGATPTYSWELQAPQGSTATLSDSAIPNPTFAPDIAGTYTATVTVSDGAQTATDSVTITTVGATPEPPNGGAELPPTVVLPNAAGDITLDHANHVTFADCLQCHPSDPPGEFAATLDQGSGHTICRDCHVANGAPNTCGTCHNN